MITISVIIAVYQSKEFICRCIDSILNQTFDDFEVLLIDDGSTDGSGDICDEYASRDNRIISFRNCHQGVSASRQFGIDHSRGAYTIFCDPDDWMDPNMLECLYKEIKESGADIVMCDVIEHLSERDVFLPQYPTRLTSECLLKEVGYPIISSLWNKLIRRDCYLSCGVNFPPNMDYAEDLFVLLKFFSCSLKFSYASGTTYHYDKTANLHSITNDLNTLIPKYIRSIEILESNFDDSAKYAIQKQKIGLLQILDKNNILEEYDCLYKNINSYLLLEGLLHPVKCRHLLVLALKRYKMQQLAWFYNELIDSLSNLKRYIN